MGKGMINKIKEMKVEKKLRYCFSLIMIVASISGVLGIVVMLVINGRYSSALVSNGFSQGEIGIFSTYLNKEPALVREMILVEDSGEIQEAVQEFEEIKAITDAALETMRSHCNTAAEKEYVDIIDETLPLYRSIFGQVQELAVDNHDQEALELLLTQGKPTLKKLTDAVEALIGLNVTMGNQVSGSLAVASYLGIALVVLVIVAAAVISLRFSKSVSAQIAEPIIKVRDASAKLARGELDIEIEKMYPDEIGEMTDSFKEAAELIRTYIQELKRGLGEVSRGNFNIYTDVDFRGDFKALDEAIVVITDTLSGTLGEIHEASEQVSMGASQMAESAQSLAEGATDQAASVEELTATIQSVTETIIHSSRKAEESSQSAEKFKGKAEESSEDMKRLNEAMERINATSKEIANIITAIEDIASQTNLLSLNASIEAARAGETGRGFAVVADQIGKLAADSAASATNTKNLIENSIREIESGNEIMARTTEVIGSVIVGIKELAATAGEISEMSASQAEAMKQLEVGVGQISEVIQNNSAAAEETSATSEELSAQSQNLEHLVGQFTLKG